MKMNQEGVYCDVTKFLVKHHGIKIIGKKYNKYCVFGMANRRCTFVYRIAWS